MYQSPSEDPLVSAPNDDGGGRAPPGASATGLVHDYLLAPRGAERVFLKMAEMWPTADIYTLLYDDAVFGRRLAGHRVFVSRLQRLGITQDGFRRLLPLYPPAVERLPVAGHEVLISSSSAFAHGVRHAPDAVHVCYCYTPFRYAWYERSRALSELPALTRPLADRYLDRQRRWDIAAAGRVTRYVAISQLSQQRIADCYGRDADIVHPPVEIDRFSTGDPEEFFLIVCELVSHKRVDVALEAARRIGARVKVVGTGPQMAALRSRFSAKAEFLGRVSDEQLAGIYPRARALLLPNVEEFGIAAVEAQASGRPVVAVNAGGATETVLDGVTGVLLDRGTTDEFAQALRATDFDSFDPARIREHACGFSPAAFTERLRAQVTAAVAEPRA
jgi:glycosyltransferase involved in cell wall biosynthesis